MRVEWSDTALGRVSEIGLYIAHDDREAAIRWTVQIFDAVEQLAEFPESGRVVPELAAHDTRELIFGSYRVFYRVGVVVQVLTVRHGSQLIRLDEVAGD